MSISLEELRIHQKVENALEYLEDEYLHQSDVKWLERIETEVDYPDKIIIKIEYNSGEERVLLPIECLIGDAESCKVALEKVIEKQRQEKRAKQIKEERRRLQIRREEYERLKKEFER